MLSVMFADLYYLHPYFSRLYLVGATLSKGSRATSSICIYALAILSSMTSTNEAAAAGDTAKSQPAQENNGSSGSAAPCARPTLDEDLAIHDSENYSRSRTTKAIQDTVKHEIDSWISTTKDSGDEFTQDQLSTFSEDDWKEIIGGMVSIQARKAVAQAEKEAWFHDKVRQGIQDIDLEILLSDVIQEIFFEVMNKAIERRIKLIFQTESELFQS
ncbi:unnamed protein product [Periconia digitata]|uniref:Uncharacterized protein n=1 Tax=Periconia digitata TaxID=1303443 RepID=A0A9W4XNB3_9PLEO|nr:unnamed protein product [Periconia digitata]